MKIKLQKKFHPKDYKNRIKMDEKGYQIFMYPKEIIPQCHLKLNIAFCGKMYHHSSKISPQNYNKLGYYNKKG
jgi:hypothetical protein